MDISYFLALPLDETDLARFFHNKKRWSPFINHDLYLSLISYNNQIYLSKKLPKFPCSLENWQQTLLHTTTLLTHTFLFPSTERLSFLACSHVQKIDFIKESLALAY